jgi:hypothetical protein
MLSKKNLPKLIRKFLIEMAVYGVLLIIYFFAVLRFLGNFLTGWYNNSLITYAVLALMLIVAQGVLLEALTSYLLKLLRLEK